MIFTFLISIVFIAEIIITVALIKALLNFDKKICELNDTVVLIKPQIAEVAELAKLISEQVKELSQKFVDDFRRNNEIFALKNLSKMMLGLFLIKTNIKFLQKMRKSKLVKTIAKGLSMLEIMV